MYRIYLLENYLYPFHQATLDVTYVEGRTELEVVTRLNNKIRRTYSTVDIEDWKDRFIEVSGKLEYTKQAWITAINEMGLDKYTAIMRIEDETTS